jgi:phage shock protein PspC (stress-responsive transcriptional regulator)
LEDITYNIIEKLYQAETPISEAYVMNLAQTIGEPEDIFENKSSEEVTTTEPVRLLDQRFGKQKPMIWGVCYWIAKSFTINVSIVRLLFLIAVFIYGTSIWLYPLLALFVPYQDKKASSGNVGNFFFELVRGIIWLALFIFLG